MTTAQALIGRARSYGRDDGGGFIDDVDYMNWLNEAALDLGARLQLFEQEISTTTAGNTLSLPTTPELVEMTSLLLGTTNYVRFVSSEEWDANNKAVTTPTDTLARVFDEHIELYPTPATGTVALLRYKMLPPRLVNGEDTVALPSHLERKMVEFSCSRARYKDGDFDGGNNWNLLYEQGLPGISDGREKFFTQPLSLQRATNIFDADPLARHI